MAKLYVFDHAKSDVLKAERTAGRILLKLLKYFALSVVLAALYYTVFALLVSTGAERRLARENRLYAKIYPQMLEREALLSDVIEGIEVKDNIIYDDIFHAKAPWVNPVVDGDLFSVNDSITDRDIAEYIARKADKTLDVASRTEENFREIMKKCSSGELPPLSVPMEDVTFAQVGASLGSKVNPFYKVPVVHNGVDIVAQQDTPVLASAAGTVGVVSHSRKGDGNVVSILHPGGYITRYCHLSDIYVRPGQTVAKGKMIGKVGISGNSYAPHLHYEVLRDSIPQDPVHYFFSSLSPDEYANIMFMSSRTGQSLD